ncbi:MAG TPA: hypothetical protein VMR52_11435 [Dehalococcoidia bacterium]|nr:hypothetical protein [Dehalococcoidia bacterium]
MKRYRVMYRMTESANDAYARTEEVYADGWRVDTDKVVLFQTANGGQESDTPVFDIPKTRVMRIQEISG